MKKLLLSIIIIAGVYGLAFGQQESSSIPANDARWVKIGEKSVDLSMDRGIFDWNNDREKSINANEKYSAIKFKAKDATVNLTNVQVEFEDGKKQDLSINSPVRVNSESKVVTLESNKELDKITFNYEKDATAADDKAKIEVWGLKADAGSAMGMGQRSSSQASASDMKWEKIGEKSVDLSMDRGIFDWDLDREKSINANEKYSAIKFKAKDATVNLTNVELEFEDGKKQDLSLNAPVQVNSESKVINLESQDELDKITFNYSKDETAEADKAKIEVWGLKANTGSGMGQRSNSDDDRK